MAPYELAVPTSLYFQPKSVLTSLPPSNSFAHLTIIPCFDDLGVTARLPARKFLAQTAIVRDQRDKNDHAEDDGAFLARAD